MELPFTLRFFKNFELFQVLKKLDKRLSQSLLVEKTNHPMWEVEKKILFWTYKAHKHLGSPIWVSDIEKENVDFKLAANEARKIGARQVFGNLVSRGYAVFYQKNNTGIFINQDNCDGIYLTTEGMMMGELIAETQYVLEINLSASPEAKKYQSLTGADFYIFNKNSKLLLYNFVIYTGYVAFIFLLLFILTEFGQYIAKGILMTCKLLGN